MKEYFHAKLSRSRKSYQNSCGVASGCSNVVDTRLLSDAVVRIPLIPSIVSVPSRNPHSYWLRSGSVHVEPGHESTNIRFTLKDTSSIHRKVLSMAVQRLYEDERVEEMTRLMNCHVQKRSGFHTSTFNVPKQS